MQRQHDKSTFSSIRSLLASSDPVSKIISYPLRYSIPDFINHQYGICRMYFEEDPQDFRIPVPYLYSRERVMLLLCAKTDFKPGSPLP